MLMLVSKLSSEEAATFTKNLSNVEGTETDSVKMVCEVSKNNAEVTWYKGDEELPEGGRYDQLMDGRKRIMIIKDLRMADAGEYNCRLSPTVRTAAILKINGKHTKKKVIKHLKDFDFDCTVFLLFFLLSRTGSRVHLPSSEPGGGGG